MNRALLILTVFATVTVAGCSGNPSSQGNNDSETASETSASIESSIAVSVPPPPEQFNSGRTEVGFDPCFEVPDSSISEAGFDPNSRERGDFVADDYSFIGCEFSGTAPNTDIVLRFLDITSSNITVDEFRDRNIDTAKEMEDIGISGRKAIVFDHLGGCWIAMESNDGTLSMHLNTPATNNGTVSCNSIVPIATVIEPSLIGE